MALIDDDDGDDSIRNNAPSDAGADADADADADAGADARLDDHLQNTLNPFTFGSHTSQSGYAAQQHPAVAESSSAHSPDAFPASAIASVAGRAGMG